jgi:hypothetical protein
MNKLRNPKFEIRNSSEAGITLLLSIFLMSTISLIAITVTALAIQGIRNSRAIALSEPAIGQAHSGAEEGIWGIKRASTLATCGSPTKNSDTPTGNVYSARQYCQSSDAVSFNLSGSSPVVFYLYDTAAPNGPPDSCTTAPTSPPQAICRHLLDLSGMDTQFGQLTADYVNGLHPIHVAVAKLNGDPVGSADITTATPERSIPLILTTGDGIDNRMSVTMTCFICASGETTTVTVNTDAGIPSVSKIESTGCAQRGAGSANQCNAGEIYSRKIEVTVPQ